ncbi:hypothetical protein FIA58_009170 [Flavobacterium jejuense]|uniref:CNNM transmembrane domain-containing protein n=1 Tax=Flavobacterium jejuense TaxID=1544455 RepID=A0ABX0ITI8_9FLAO|nr:hypothetical protein [Flavobacterium jejuense]NHN25843.1 hypothetical protein [Flavobacterium jejuense]
MKLLKSPWIITIAVLIAGVFFSNEIVDLVAKASPDLANKLSRNKTTA